MPLGTRNQTTAWVYGVGLTIGADLFSNDLVATVEYPDKSTGSASSSAANDQTLGYNFLGEKSSFTGKIKQGQPPVVNRRLSPLVSSSPLVSLSPLVSSIRLAEFLKLLERVAKSCL
jgi:hypothetical protein